MEGKITKIISNSFTVLADREYICQARGKFKKTKTNLLVGDNVVFDEIKKIILEVKKRNNSLIRPPIANVDQSVIVVSVKEPDLDLYLLDKLICLIEFNNIKPIICFTKLDLLDDLQQINEIKKYYQKIGYQVFYNNDMKIRKIFKNKITVFAGQSGAGKSTLLNILDNNLNLKTSDISKALGRGKHTTRHVELLKVLGGLCADTPGFSSLSLMDLTKEDIRDNFVEFNNYREYCGYKDCCHDKEEDCEIKRRLGKDILLSRYENYIKFLRKERT